MATSMQGARGPLRRLLIAAALPALVTLGCLPAATQAAETAKLKVAFSPYKLGATTSLGMTMTVTNTNGGLPSPATGFDLHLPSQLELLGSTLGLAVCQPTALLANGLGGCSPNARLGSGSAQVAVPFGPETVSETAHIEALMGPASGEQVGVLVYAESNTPVLAQLVFPGILLVGSGPESLDTTIPPTPTLPGAPDASLTHISLEVGPEHLIYYKRVHGRSVGYHPTGISLPSRCPRGGFTFETDMRFQDGTALRVPYTVPCPSPRRR
jgi:hypothetical protein